MKLGIQFTIHWDHVRNDIKTQSKAMDSKFWDFREDQKYDTCQCFLLLKTLDDSRKQVKAGISLPSLGNHEWNNFQAWGKMMDSGSEQRVMFWK